MKSKMNKLNELVGAVRKYHGDRSRTAAKTLDGLEEARDEIDMLIDALKCEIE